VSRARIVVLYCLLVGCCGRREAGLKILEMIRGGHFPVGTETDLGLRHGPMFSFLREDTLVLCMRSRGPVRRPLRDCVFIQELRTTRLGYSVGIAATVDHAPVDNVILHPSGRARRMRDPL